MDAGLGLRPRPGAAWTGRRKPQGFPPATVPAARLDQNPARRPLVLRSDAGSRSTDPIRGASLKGLCCHKSAGNQPTNWSCSFCRMSTSSAISAANSVQQRLILVLGHRIR
uniref:Uncharacterized protein n=1 Tax=Aegilops tauschii subsp. strangulata TaxID=200361 RepID=A0A453D9U8_AEGTS